ncbi:MAG: curli-like amyloid fiber formation chaperone CsgH [Sphingorhabdus sp.]
MMQSSLMRILATIPIIALMAMTIDSPAGTTQSLKLDVSVDQGMHKLTVIGNSNIKRNLRYRMTVSGGSTSTTSGRVQLMPGRSVTVATVRVNAHPGWMAELEVSGDETYTVNVEGR